MYKIMTFRDTLKRLMDERGIQQKSLALSIGVGQSTISQWLTGKREPNGPARKKLIEYLKITEAELFGGTSNPVKDIRIPVVGSAKGGADAIDVEESDLFPQKYVEFRDCKSILVKGESMSPVAYPGQKIIYSESKVINDGDLVYVGLKDGNKYFKRYYKDRKNNIVTLQPINVANHHGPLNIKEKDIDFIHKVVGVSYI